MSDEITIQSTVKLRKGDYQIDLGKGSFQDDQAGNGSASQTLLLTTGYVEITAFDLLTSDAGWAYMFNAAAPTGGEVHIAIGTSGARQDAMIVPIGKGYPVKVLDDTVKWWAKASGGDGTAILNFTCLEA